MPDSLITKKAIAQALKEVCRRKPFDKISISDLTASCGMNRQSFYYHFQDKYELLSWIYYHENFNKITDHIDFDNWDQKILEMLKIMEQEKWFYCNTLKDQQHTFESYLYEMAKALFMEAITGLDVRKKLTADEREFYAEFYAYGICGVIISWAQKGMKLPPAVVAGHLKSLAKDSEHIASIFSQITL